MAQKTLSPELVQQIVDFKQKYPDVDLANGGFGDKPLIAAKKAGIYTPQMSQDFNNLFHGLRDAGFHLNDSGDPEQNRAAWKNVLLAAATIGGPLVAGALLGSGAASAGGAAGTGLTVPTGTTAAEAATTGVLPSAGTIGGVAPITGAAGAGSAAPGILATAGKLATRFSPMINAGAKAVGEATQAAGQNRMDADTNAMKADQNYETELNARAKTEADQRQNALKDVYRQSWYANRSASPYDTKGPTPVSADLMTTLNGLEQQGMKQLANDPQYNVAGPNVDPLKKFKPTPASAGEKVGTYAAPILSTIGSFFK